MKKVELLRAIYESIRWDRLYQLVPEASRQEVDELFARMRQALAGADEPSPPAAAPVAAGSVDLYCDGASRGNPGPAGIGIVIRTPDGEELLAWGEAIGRTTNNVAEYRALLAALRKALELKARRVRVLCDSELLIKQIKGAYRVRNAALKPLHAEAVGLLKRFEQWEVAYVPRDQNTQADGLASAHAKQQATSATQTPGAGDNGQTG